MLLFRAFRQVVCIRCGLLYLVSWVEAGYLSELDGGLVNQRLEDALLQMDNLSGI